MLFGNLKKRVTVLILLVFALTVTGCAAAYAPAGDAASNTQDDAKSENTETAGQPEHVDETVKESEPAGKSTQDISGEIKNIEREHLLSADHDESDILAIRPSVPDIAIEGDFENITNRSDIEYMNDEFKAKLKENGFVVTDNAGREFYEIYESNRYGQTPSFVTVDSLMHTYHIYFAYLLRDIEKNHLYDELVTLTGDMLKESCDQYEELYGTEWESAAKRNIALFSVAAVLLDDKAMFPEEVRDIVESEYNLIMSAEGIGESVLTGDFEDYSQYKPRGYYEGDATLEKYFRAMMWYGRRQFDQKEEDMDRSAMLMTLALDNGNYDRWSSIYTVTAFFAGASDDLGYCEYMPVIEKAYGKKVKVSDIAGKADEWNTFHAYTAKLRPPRLNSIPIMDTPDSDNVILGYRFMGQRFTIDATIMQELVYSRVGEFEDEDKRMLPDFLDVPAALGSEMAYSILKEQGVTKYKNYDTNLENMKKEFINDDTQIWNASLYAGWLNTLRPLLEKKGEGYPAFMQTDEWTKKNLETFAGSYTELKHDTILYAKQMMAEMGGGWEEDKDFRGYVEPEPLVYHRFMALAEETAEGLDRFGYISKADKENLDKLAQLAGKLKEISVKELQNEKLTDDEYELIEIYGGEIEHFWFEAMKAQTGVEYPTSDDYPAALVVDVATDPNGTVLEMATGDPATVYVVVPVDGKLRVAEGSVYSFYQFEQPISDRLTDKEWRQMMGIEINSEGSYNYKHEDVKHPSWVDSYRYYWTWD
ncbi:MAG: DUF3160 domain-containing protein [Lachnospiraceae bacterium]|nr:DUF3160 domain-containing protein [Lachnospiraceae bacterium]